MISLSPSFSVRPSGFSLDFYGVLHIYCPWPRGVSCYWLFVIVDKTIIILYKTRNWNNFFKKKIKTIRILTDDDRVEKSDNRDCVILLFKSLHGLHTVKFARLVHLDCFLKIADTLSLLSVISKLITVVNFTIMHKQRLISPTVFESMLWWPWIYYGYRLLHSESDIT